MNSDEAFGQSGGVIDTDPLMVLLARSQGAVVIDALKGRPDVVAVIPSGNAGRGADLGSIHDVDLIVVFDKSMHPDWGGSGSAQAVLEHLQSAIRETLQAGPGQPLGLVLDTRLRNHVVRCDLDRSMGPFNAVIPDLPPVDVMPAVRQGSHLGVPERRTDRWIDVDPEQLMRMVAARQRTWSNFDQIVRMIKGWADYQGLKMKPLAVELLVLQYLPRPGLSETMSCSDAVARFFEAASRAHISGLADPAGRYGEIDPQMNYGLLRKALDTSAELTREAVDAERAWKIRHPGQEGVTHPSVFWQEIFGRGFKRPGVWDWSSQFPAARPSPESRLWLDEPAEQADESAWSWTPWHADPAGDGAWRMCIAVEVEHYSQLNDAEQAEGQRTLLGLIQEAGEHGGFEPAQWLRQLRGDGELALLPPGVDETQVIFSLWQELRDGLHRYNTNSSPAARLRVRVAVHEGLAYVADNGFAGDAIITVCRLCDSAEARDALRTTADDLVLIGSDRVFQNVINGSGARGLPPSAFREVTVDLPRENSRAQAFIFSSSLPADKEGAFIGIGSIRCAFDEGESVDHHADFGLDLARESTGAAEGSRSAGGDAPSSAAPGGLDIRAGNPVGRGGPGGGPPERGSSGGAVAEPRRRYLRCECPESIPVREPFSLLASIVLAGPASAGLKPFDVPPAGRDVLLVVHAPGLRLLGDQRQTVHVPAGSDSERVMFELRADQPGVRTVSVTAWIGGSYLGELRIDVVAERDQPAGTHRDLLAEITTEPTEGAVSLVVRFDPHQNAYRFEFRDEDNPDEVTSNLAYEPGPRVEQIVAGLDDLAKGRSGHSGDRARDYLVQSGAALWSELVPPQLREQFWDRQHRIGQLTILADKDAVPWELLYPMDPGHDDGFLVDQFPVTRAIFGQRPARRLSLWPARFVLPGDALPEAQAEIDAMRRSLDPGQLPDEVISALPPLQDLIASGDFGLLHFACHNTYSPAAGSSIKLGNVQFTPTLMTTAAINKTLGHSAPTVFINACRSAGLNATYNRLDSWASKFLDAGAAAFIGTLWAVCDGAAREFAQELYSSLQGGSSLGEAIKCAREAAASQPDDPTWLAYTVYGDPRATLCQPRP
jgi:hypothetical protein